MRRSRPVPWQFGHGFSITVPLPRQRGHGCESEKSPCDSDVTPRPLHSGQMTGDGSRLRAGAAALAAGGVDLDRDLRLHALERVLERKVDDRLDVGAALRLPARAAPPRPPRLKIAAEDVAEVEVLQVEVERHAARARAAAHAPVADRRRTACASRGSDSTSYAVCTSLNFASADSSSGLRSGWYWRASLRYAFLISSCDAFFATPSVS